MTHSQNWNHAWYSSCTASDCWVTTWLPQLLPPTWSHGISGQLSVLPTATGKIGKQYSMPFSTSLYRMWRRTASSYVYPNWKFLQIYQFFRAVIEITRLIWKFPDPTFRTLDGLGELSCPKDVPTFVLENGDLVALELQKTARMRPTFSTNIFPQISVSAFLCWLKGQTQPKLI